MLEITGASLLILWVLGLVTGFSEGLAIHLLLLGAGVVFLVKHLSSERTSPSSGSAHHRALMPTPLPRRPKGDIALTPRTRNPGRRLTPPAAPRVSSGRPGLADLASAAPPAAKAG